MIGFIFAVIIFVSLAILLRRIASRENPKFVVIVPPNTQAIVTTMDNKVTDLTKGGGNITNVIHAIPGKRIDKSAANSMDWHYIDEEESRGLLYSILGIQFIWFFRGLLLNDVRTFRFGRKDEEGEYHLMTKSQRTRYVFFSGQHDIQIKEVETKSILKINLLFNVIYETTYPVRVLLRTADPFAVLTMMVNQIAIRMVGRSDPKELITNQAVQKALSDKIHVTVSGDAEEQLGITIKKVILADVDYDIETQKLLELEKKTELENAAAIAIADKNKRVQILANDADADRIERVIKPAAESERTVAVRVAEAYEKNNVVTTFAPGAGNTMIPLGQNK